MGVMKTLLFWLFAEYFMSFFSFGGRLAFSYFMVIWRKSYRGSLSNCMNFEKDVVRWRKPLWKEKGRKSKQVKVYDMFSKTKQWLSMYMFYFVSTLILFHSKTMPWNRKLLIFPNFLHNMGLLMKNSFYEYEEYIFICFFVYSHKYSHINDLSLGFYMITFRSLKVSTTSLCFLCYLIYFYFYNEMNEAFHSLLWCLRHFP